MPTWEETLALRHAPVLLQKVHNQYKRADFITRANFASQWQSIHKNWDAVWQKKDGDYKHKLTAHGYYSIVETHTHYYLVYAFYHPQDWSGFYRSPAKSSPEEFNQHLHDMEGCLAVVPKREKRSEEKVEAIVTISHFDFYSFAGWEKHGERIEGHYLIKGWAEDLDGPIQVTDRFKDEPGEPAHRFKIYADSGGHAIKGARRRWGSENRIVRYRPSLSRAEEPDEGGFVKDEDAYFQTVNYKLVSIFAPGGLWAQRENPRVLQPNQKGGQAFVKRDKNGNFVAGSANPPWGWDDRNDRHKPGDFAWDPAHLVAGYFKGLREFSREYVHNRYIDVVKSQPT